MLVVRQNVSNHSLQGFGGIRYKNRPSPYRMWQKHVYFLDLGISMTFR